MKGFPGSSVVKNLLANAEDTGEAGSTPEMEDPLEEGMATHSSILAWESHGQRSLVGYSIQGGKELDTTEATEHASCTEKMNNILTYQNNPQCHSHMRACRI